MKTVDATIRTRLSPDLLVAIYDAAYCAGAGLDSEPPSDPLLAALIAGIAARHQAEYLAARGWLDPVIPHDELPGWLLRLPRQR